MTFHKDCRTSRSYTATAALITGKARHLCTGKPECAPPATALQMSCTWLWGLAGWLACLAAPWHACLWLPSAGVNGVASLTAHALLQRRVDSDWDLLSKDKELAPALHNWTSSDRAVRRRSACIANAAGLKVWLSKG